MDVDALFDEEVDKYLKEKNFQAYGERTGRGLSGCY